MANIFAECRWMDWINTRYPNQDNTGHEYEFRNVIWKNGKGSYKWVDSHTWHWFWSTLNGLCHLSFPRSTIDNINCTQASHNLVRWSSTNIAQTLNVVSQTILIYGQQLRFQKSQNAFLEIAITWIKINWKTMMTNSLKTRVEFSMTTTVDYFIIFLSAKQTCKS